ncbi:MAG: twin-arginine translocation signal domain-containing protein, partial [Gemmatimonadaceae bacterium]
MSPSRRDFLKGVGKGVGATAALALYSHDLVAQLLADAPRGRVLESKFKGMADIVLGEAKLGGCSYADVRFTMTASPPGGTANFRAAGEAGPGGEGGRGAGGRGGGGGFGGGGGGRGGG